MGTKDRYSWQPRKLQYFFKFYFTMGIHGSKAGGITLNSKTNKQFDKLKKELNAPRPCKLQETSSLF